MESFDVAHLNIKQVNVIIIFLGAAFDHQPQQEQRRIHVALQAAASGAGLAGNVVPVWVDSFGHTKFIAPQNQHPYFQSASYEELYMQRNKTLTIQ